MKKQGAEIINIIKALSKIIFRYINDFKILIKQEDINKGITS